MQFTQTEVDVLKRIAEDENRSLDNLLETIIKKYVKNNITDIERIFSDDSNTCMVDIETILNLYK